jgi:hypothetical protein
MKWENNIFGMIPKEAWLEVGFDVARPNDPIDGLFGDLKTDNIVAEWESIAAENQLPVMAQFHAFDTEAQIAIREPIDKHNVEKGLIKVKIDQSERLRALVNSGVRESKLYDYVMNDGIRLADQVITRTKVAKNELLASGKITIKENDIDLTVDYGVPAAQLQHTVDFGANADVIGQIATIVETAATNGTILTGMVLSGSLLTKMRKHASVQKAINGTKGVGATVRKSDFLAYMEEEFGLSQIITNDLTYTYNRARNADGSITNQTARYFPADRVAFIATNPAGNLGVGLWGDAPEVEVNHFFDGGASTESPFVNVMQWATTDPAVLWTKASALFMPVLYNPTNLYVATATNI